MAELRETYEELNKEIQALKDVEFSQLTEHQKKHAQQHFPGMSAEEAVGEFRQMNVLSEEEIEEILSKVDVD